MKKVIKVVFVLILLISTTILGYKLYMDYRIKHAKIIVETIDNLDIEVYSKIKLKDLISNINGNIIKNNNIDTSKLGKQEIQFEYINEENLKIPYKFEIDIVDTTSPLISYQKHITLYKDTEIDLKSKFFCGDNYDDKPKCEVIGEYNLKEVGDYNLTFKATDSKGNESQNNFTLHIIERPQNSQNNNTNPTKTVTNFSDIYNKYKTENTKIGIDISYHQGSIEYEKVKEAGAEFVFIRVGYQKGKDGEYILDSKFKDNISGFAKQNIKVGIYFFSYADSKEKAKKQARWVLKQIKKYKIDLPIVFDWESWSNYSEYNLSFYNLTEVAMTFINEIEKAGYKGMLYSSKNYLEKIWMNLKTDIWLAHYTEKTDYKGKYKVWQLCEDGVIDGINDNNVDIDILYE